MGRVTGLFAALLLSTSTVLATPAPHFRPPFPHQYVNSSISGMTQTLTETTPPPYMPTAAPTREYNITNYPYSTPGLYDTTTITVLRKSSAYVVAPTTVYSTTWVTITEAHAFTQGWGHSASIRTVWITKTVTKIVPCPTTTIFWAGPTSELPSEPPSETATMTEVTTASSGTSTAVYTPTPIPLSSSMTASSSLSSVSCVTAVPPGPTAGSTAVNCKQWHVAQSGEYCESVAQEFGVAVDDFMAWNPSVIAPTCPHMLAGYAYCVAACGQSSSVETPPLSSPSTLASSPISSMLTTTFSSSSILTSSSSSSTLTTSSTLSTLTFSTLSSSQTPLQTGSGVQEYTVYTGDGTTAQGWPSQDQWVDFDYMFEINVPDMRESCAAWGVPDDREEEIATMKDAIQSLASQTGVDERLILAVIMQESTGCVRVITTAYSVMNPGLMQSHDGEGSCNTNNAPFGIPGVDNTGTVQTPCPSSEIYQMVQDGTAGTASGDGLQQLLALQTRTDVSRFYRAARMYNGGTLSIGADGNLESGCCTACYVSDIANRLTGWTNAPRECSL